MKVILFIAYILLIMTDIMIVYMIIHDLKRWNRLIKEDFILCIIGEILFFNIVGIAALLTFYVGYMMIN